MNICFKLLAGIVILARLQGCQAMEAPQKNPIDMRDQELCEELNKSIGSCILITDLNCNSSLPLEKRQKVASVRFIRGPILCKQDINIKSSYLIYPFIKKRVTEGKVSLGGDAQYINEIQEDIVIPKNEIHTLNYRKTSYEFMMKPIGIALAIIGVATGGVFYYREALCQALRGLKL